MTKETELETEKKSPAIWAKGLTQRFGEEVAVHQVDLEIPTGTIFGFVGPSGSGKTTTIRLLTGVMEPSEGEVQILGTKPTTFSQTFQEKIGYMPQLFVLYPELTVWENMGFIASIYGLGTGRKEKIKKQLDLVELTPHKNKPAEKISGGMKRRLSLAATLVHDPSLIFLDEPTAGIDPILRNKMWDHFKELKKEGRTLFITTQYVGEAAYCDMVGVLDRGQLIAVDTPRGLKHQAYGGDIVELIAAERIEFSKVKDLEEFPFIREKIQQIGGNRLRIVADDASTAIPKILEWGKNHELNIRSVKEQNPPFDHVFLELIKKEEVEIV